MARSKSSFFLPLLTFGAVSVAGLGVVLLPAIVECPPCRGRGQITGKDLGLTWVTSCGYCNDDHRVTLGKKWLYRPDPELGKKVAQPLRDMFDRVDKQSK